MTHVKKHSRREPLAAYDGGEHHILCLQTETGSTDSRELATKDVLRRDTRSYVPAVLAVISLFAHRNLIGETE